ncbi:hypothetical protein [Thermosyntropha sp.]|uniref:hypothetical protein n=1 Tax=Thermosyntropha sp. TaxID=2740820 RepID=UPI0025EE0601|nr:hypothetical protein [Thermosyntropha sp.]MBO8158531.1 hypothetical protein [Thermosyntropha sp.]
MNDKDRELISDEEILGVLGIPATVIGSREWKELENRGFSIGEDNLLDEILKKKVWSNTEIIWVIKRLIFYYGKKDELLLKVPKERLFMNMVDILRAFFILFDSLNPSLDDNIRSYISAKLTDSTWGITSHTRNYLAKIKD